MPLDANLTHESNDEPDRFGFTLATGVNLGAILSEALEYAKAQDKERAEPEATRALLDLLVWWTGNIAKDLIDNTATVLTYRRNQPGHFTGGEVIFHTSLPMNGPGRRPRRSKCAASRGNGMSNFGGVCDLEIVQHDPLLPWVHAGNSIEAADAGRDHAAVYSSEGR